MRTEKRGPGGVPLVMLGKVRGLEREKHRFESRGGLSLQINIFFIIV